MLKGKLLISSCLFAVFLFLVLGGDLGGSALAQPPQLPQRPQTPQEEMATKKEVTPAGELRQQIPKEKIKQIRDRVREKIQERIKEIKEKGRRRAYVGKILKIEGLQITLKTKKGEREISIDEKAQIVGPKRQKLEPDDLQPEQMIICMGRVDPEGRMLAKRIVVIPKPPRPPLPRRAVFGKVTEIGQDSLILTLFHPRKETSTLRVETTNKTKITKKLEGKIQKVDFSVIQEDDRLIAIGTWEEKDKILTAKIIHIIPGRFKGLKKPSPPETSPTPAVSPP